MWTCRSNWCYAHVGWGGWGGMLTFMWTCRERSSKLCEICSCCEETEKQNWSHMFLGRSSNTVFMFILMLLMMMMMMWWWWWCWWSWWCDDDDDDPNETCQFRRRNFVTEWTSFTNLIQVCAVPRAGTRLYIHIDYMMYLNDSGYNNGHINKCVWDMGTPFHSLVVLIIVPKRFDGYHGPGETHHPNSPKSRQVWDSYPPVNSRSYGKSTKFDDFAIQTWWAFPGRKLWQFTNPKPVLGCAPGAGSRPSKWWRRRWPVPPTWSTCRTRDGWRLRHGIGWAKMLFFPTFFFEIWKIYTVCFYSEIWFIYIYIQRGATSVKQEMQIFRGTRTSAGWCPLLHAYCWKRFGSRGTVPTHN